MASTTHRFAFLGGIYSNYLALEMALRDITSRGVEEIWCLGDLGAFGPYPDRVFPLIHDYGIQCIQGNYDDSIGNQRDDCQCGYTDPRDNYFAQISYDYTLANTSAEHREFLRNLPAQRRLDVGGRKLLLCHGSPRKVNEFLWESATSTHFLQAMCDEFDADLILGTHTGIKWHRNLGPKADRSPVLDEPGHLEKRLEKRKNESKFDDAFAGKMLRRTDETPGSLFHQEQPESNSRARHFINVGAIGRPENDGRTNVWYTLLELNGKGVNMEFVPVEYDYRRLAREIRAEGLPDEFAETIETGWWTTCLEILPGKERRTGIH